MTKWKYGLNVLGLFIVAQLVACGTQKPQINSNTTEVSEEAEVESEATLPKGLIPKDQDGVEAQVVGGYTASPNLFPFVVSLGHCTGSIINAQWILTAKHCVNGRTPASIQVVAGEHKKSEDEGPEQKRNGVQFIKHPSRDLALVKLNYSLFFNQQVKPIDVGNSPTLNTYFVAAGWGATNPNGSGPSDVLKWHIPKRAAASVCGSLSGEFCGEDTSNRGWQVCFGDSGGPAFYFKNGAWKLGGAVQRAATTGTGGPCEKGLAIYAAMDRYWIKKNAQVTLSRYDTKEGKAPDFRKLTVAYTGLQVMVDIQFYKASDVNKAGHNVYLYGDKRDTLQFSKDKFYLRRDEDANGHFEKLIISGKVKKLNSTTLQLKMPKFLMSDISKKRVWIYSQTSKDRLPNTGYLQMK